MIQENLNNNILSQIKEILLKEYDDLIVSIYGFGSRIKQNITDTDFDIAIITSQKLNWIIEYNITKINVDFGIDNNIVFDIHFFSSEELEHTYRKHPFIKNIKKEAVIFGNSENKLMEIENEIRDLSIK